MKFFYRLFLLSGRREVEERRNKLFCDTWMTFYYLIPVRVCSTFYSMIKSNQDEVFFHSSYPDVPLRNSINRNWIKNSFLLNTMTEKYDHSFMKKLRGNIFEFPWTMVGNCSFATNDDVVALGFSKVLVPIWCRFIIVLQELRLKYSKYPQLL